VLAEYLRHYIKQDQTNWDEWVPLKILVHNTTEHSSIYFTPFELVFGRRTSLASDKKESPEPRYNYDDYATELKNKLQKAHKTARENLMKVTAHSKGQ
jgi:hypothetical protein